MSKEKTTTFNFKLRPNTREYFKKITREQGTTMQAVLAAFVEFYSNSPEIFKFKMEIKKMKTDLSNIKSEPIKPLDPVYKYTKLVSMEIREVLKDSEPNGEYHIRPLTDIAPQVFVNYFTNTLPGCEVSVLDFGGKECLSHPICLIIKNEMQKGAVQAIFEAADTVMIS